MAKTSINQSEPFRAWFGGKALPLFAKAIIARRGAELYVVGGAVRDALLGRPGRRDLDLVARGVPLGALIKLLKQYGRVDEVGRVFGVIKFLPRGSKNDAIDIALPRTEFSFGTGGYKDVETKSRHNLSLEADLGRRDFTVNAMAWNLGAEKLVDPFGGERDLSKQILRAVGEPEQRFKEDYTRILRLLRFAIELDFEIQPATWRAAKNLAPRLNDRRGRVWVVPRELIAKELLKSFAADPAGAFDLWDEVGVFRVLVPELTAMKGVPQPLEFHTEGDVWAHTRLALQTLAKPIFRKRFPEGFDAETALAVLFHDIGKPPTLKLPVRDKVDRIRFDGHDQQGARMVRAIAERLTLSSYKAIPPSGHLERIGGRIDVSPERLEWVVAHHLLMVNAAIDELRPRTIEKYFLTAERPGDLLRKLMFCDVAATINVGGRPAWGSFNALEKRIKKVAVLKNKKGAMPKPLLDGRAILKISGLAPGPRIGKLVELLRDAQLGGRLKNKREAEAFLRAKAKIQ